MTGAVDTDAWRPGDPDAHYRNLPGVERAYEIATSCERVAAMAIGLEDYTADLGVARTEGGEESFYARTRLVNACRAASIQPIDSVYSDVGDMEGLARNVARSKSLGFEGMGCIHPRQIGVILEGFRPTLEETEKAARIIEAFEEASLKGRYRSNRDKMIDLGVKKKDPCTLRFEKVTIACSMDQLINAAGRKVVSSINGERAIPFRSETPRMAENTDRRSAAAGISRPMATKWWPACEWPSSSQGFGMG
jgi:hypothetical protein